MKNYCKRKSQGEFTFNADGTGVTTFENFEEEPHSWTWFFDGSNKIYFDDIAGSPSLTEGEQIIYSRSYVYR